MHLIEKVHAVSVREAAAQQETMNHSGRKSSSGWLPRVDNIAYSSSEALVVFFFSSRRRHTRFDCDWSSDVCSSDLYSYLSKRRTPVRAGSAACLSAYSRRGCCVPSIPMSSSGSTPTRVNAAPHEPADRKSVV